MMRALDETVKLVKNEYFCCKETADSYNNAIKRFNGLVERGVVSPRKNQIMSIEERHKIQIKYNAN